MIAALVAAMFVALQSVSAAACVANPGISLGIGENCTVTHTGKGDTVATVSDATGGATVTAVVGTPATDGVVTIEVTAGSPLGTAKVTISDTATDGNGDGDTLDPGEAAVTLATYDVTVLGFGIKSLAVKGDTDGVVSAGPQVTVVATVRSAVAASDVRLTVPTTGLSIQSRDATSGDLVDGTTQQQTRSVAAAGTQMLEFTVNTAGAPAGDYELTFTADQDGEFATTPSKPVTTAVTALGADPAADALAVARTADAETSQQVIQTLTLTIGEPGTGLASATLSLGNSVNDLPFTDKDETVAETGSDVAKAAGDADGKINLVVEAFDSLGGKANSSSVNQIIVIAPGGTISATRMNTADPPAAVTESGDSSLTLDEDGTTPPDVGQRTGISVSKADGKPGTVTVYAIVSGPGGAARTDNVVLTFSGPAASLTVADATESLLSVNTVGDNPETDPVEDDFVIQDTIKLQVTAEDSGGNSAVPPTGGVSIVITDPNGKRQGNAVIERSQPTKGADGNYYITLTGTGSAAKPLASGTWSIDVKSGSLEASATFAVAGAPADVDVTASQTSSDTIGDVITITASVTDKDGNTVSDGTMVMFDVSMNTGLSAIGTGHKGKATKDGSAAVKYAVTGAGHSVVSATAGDATGVVVIDSTAGAPAPVEEAPTEPSLSDFSGTSGLVSYSGPDATASELMALLAGRASSIWLSVNGSWVLYANVDGAMVPGSSDFTVTSGDVLYISN